MTFCFAGAISILVGVIAYFDQFTFFKIYFNGRGEHIIEEISSSRLDLPNAIRYILSNILSLLLLLYNIGTEPTITDFSFSTGQMINTLFVPFLFLGAAISIFNDSVRANKLIVLWFLFFTIPIIFTSNVHIGRLFFSILPMSILISFGFHYVFRAISHVTKSHNFKIGSAFIICIYILFALSNETNAYFQNTEYDTYPGNILGKIDQNKPVIILNFDAETLAYWRLYYHLKGKYKIEDFKGASKQIESTTNSYQKIAYSLKKNALMGDVYVACENNSQIILVGYLRKKYDQIAQIKLCKGNLYY